MRHLNRLFPDKNGYESETPQSYEGGSSSEESAPTDDPEFGKIRIGVDTPRTRLRRRTNAWIRKLPPLDWEDGSPSAKRRKTEENEGE